MAQVSNCNQESQPLFLPPCITDHISSAIRNKQQRMERTTEWIFSLEIPSDVTVHAAGVPFSLHKFPLVSKSGYMRHVVLESGEVEKTVIVLPDVPGGSEGFELAAKFCYGIHFDVTPDNAATVRCVAEYLDMTEKYAANNLVQRSETYINEVALKTLPAAIAVLHNCESFLPIAEKVKLVSRCIDAIAFLSCKESRGQVAAATPASMSPLTDHHVVDWWTEDLAALRIDIFQRVLVAMMSRGFKHAALGPILTLYAQKSLCCLDTYGTGARKIEPQLAQEKRVVVETVTGLLPREKNAVSASFISMLLRASILVETTVACRVDLERRMGSQLGRAVLDDVLIPTYDSSSVDTLFDVDTLQRMVSCHLEFELRGSCADREHVGKLLESCIAEISSDPNLSVAKFVTLAEIIPDHYKVTEDGVYRAVDIYLKAHPTLSDLERKKVCGVMNCQRLSKEACAHAAQNDRLPVHTVVQVLFYEQQRLQSVISDNLVLVEAPTGNACSCSIDNLSAALEVASFRRENEALKLENLRLKKRLEDLEKRELVRYSGSGSGSSPVRNSTTQSPDKPGFLQRRSYINSMSKRLRWFYPFAPIGPAPGSASTTIANPKTWNRPRRTRRHSLS
uniref:Phototropic-responsive NPH3 family protein n=2 Tax=Kalanchoe fedtschenkoi TaxID=63787 RepID=A0A7N0ULU9_KALFE